MTTPTDGLPGSDSKTSVEKRGDRELVVIRSFDAPLHIVYRAWADPALFRQWWVPRSYGMTLVSCEMDVRVGGTYRLEIGHAASDHTMAFFVKGFGRLRTKASSAGTRGPHALVYG